MELWRLRLLAELPGFDFSTEAVSMVYGYKHLCFQNSARVGPAWLARQTLSCHLLSVQ